MNQNFNYSNSNLDKVMTTEQFDRVVEAIISGKYSWACLLILRFAGYNPLHYIPYRTYNRIMKDNQDNKSQQKSISPKTKAKSAHKLQDLTYFEEVDRQSVEVIGGARVNLLDYFWQ
ncbi:HetP family heterocyst commitment protein [Myxosarcina sp. GI1]|uniref:HetP family heterocyst commitment protein n=1 Tax=Myxosarcina sp. GI1 TaxID=1541065 RepID=UPI00055F612B|nr:HetP family heterocyst commitment protein [Myxosarcina sp. GI1]